MKPRTITIAVAIAAIGLSSMVWADDDPDAAYREYLQRQYENLPECPPILVAPERQKRPEEFTVEERMEQQERIKTQGSILRSIPLKVETCKNTSYTPPMHPLHLREGLLAAEHFFPNTDGLPECPPPTKAERDAPKLPPMSPEEIKAYYKEHPPTCQPTWRKERSKRVIEKQYPPTERVPYWHFGDPAHGEPPMMIPAMEPPSREEIKQAEEFYKKHLDILRKLERANLPDDEREFLDRRDKDREKQGQQQGTK